MLEVTIKTNNQPRPIINFNDIPKKIRENEFSYREEEFQGPFFKFKNEYYDISEFTIVDQNLAESHFKGWDGIMPQGFFFGILIKWHNFYSDVVIGTYCS